MQIPNMPQRNEDILAGASPVPTYALYGESDHHQTLHLMHCESIPARSARYGWRIAPHQHDVLFQVLYVSAGGGTADLEGSVSDLAAGSLVVVPPLSIHGFDFRTDVHGWVVSVPDTVVRELAGMLAIGLDMPRHLRLARDTGQREEVEELLRRIAGEYRHRRHGRALALQSLTTLLLVAVARLLRTWHARGMPGARQISHVQRYRTLIEETYRSPRPIHAYAEQLGISPTQLNRLCRNTTGKSALELLHDRILLEAKRDLIFTTVGITEIAYSLGFRDPAYFSRFFAQRAGASPSRFRDTRQRAMAAGADPDTV